jgi:peptidoglycan/xylan/chitin deacetylase (PgdA/CDA1 family)
MTKLSFKAKGKEFMITFDDGPVSQTVMIIDALKKFTVNGEPVRAGFFMLGNSDNPLYYPPPLWEIWWGKGSVKEYPQIVRYVAQQGHLIGNHTQHHPWFGHWWAFGFNSKEDFVRNEIAECNSEIELATGNPTLKIFRPPYVQDNQAIREGSKGLGFKVIWGATVGDTWPRVSVETVKNNALKVLKNWEKDEPCVLIFHDIRPATYEGIEEIIGYLQDQGFRLAHFNPALISEENPKQAFFGTLVRNNSKKIGPTSDV